MRVQFNSGFSVVGPSTAHNITKKSGKEDSKKIQSIFANAASQTLAEVLKDNNIKELWERVEKRFGEKITIRCVPRDQAPSGSYFKYDFSISETFRKVTRVSKPVICVASDLKINPMKAAIVDALCNLVAYTDSEIDPKMVAEQIFQYDCGNGSKQSEWQQNRKFQQILTDI